MQVVLAWAFVALRVIHSYVHIVVRNVRTRALIYWLSTAVLIAMWVGFAVDSVTAARAYNATMATLDSAAP